MPAPVVRCTSPWLSLSSAELGAWCERWEVGELRLTGSALVGPFRPDSDVDFVFFASYRSRVYAPEGWAQPEAVRELAELAGGRRVDLVCARQTVTSRNPYATHNFLVRPEFPRALGLLHYFEQVAAALEALGDPVAALASSQRSAVHRALLTFASVVDTEDRIAMLRSSGLEGPWDEARAVLGPELERVRKQQRPRWTADDGRLARLAHAIVASRGAAAELVRKAPRPPPLAPEVVRHALGDTAPTPPPCLHLRPSRSREDVAKVCRRWQVRRLIERIGDAAGAPARAVAFASVRSPLYLGAGKLEPRALRELSAVGFQIECARALVATANPGLVYNAFVRAAFSDHDVALWFLREGARALRAAITESDALAALRRLRLGAAAAGPEFAALLDDAGDGGPTSWRRCAAAAADVTGDGEPVVDASHIRLPAELVAEAVGDMAPADRWQWHP